MIKADSFRKFVTKMANYEDKEIVSFLHEWLRYFEALERVERYFSACYEDAEEVKVDE